MLFKVFLIALLMKGQGYLTSTIIQTSHRSFSLPAPLLTHYFRFFSFFSHLQLTVVVLAKENSFSNNGTVSLGKLTDETHEPG